MTILLDDTVSPTRALVRTGPAERLTTAHLALPARIGLRVVAGHRPPAVHAAIIATYTAELRAVRPGASAAAPYGPVAEAAAA
jgi:zinc D-Ala-D-Ala dipeptidase